MEERGARAARRWLALLDPPPLPLAVALATDGQPEEDAQAIRDGFLGQVCPVVRADRRPEVPGSPLDGPLSALLEVAEAFADGRVRAVRHSARELQERITSLASRVRHDGTTWWIDPVDALETLDHRHTNAPPPPDPGAVPPGLRYEIRLIAAPRPCGTQPSYLHDRHQGPPLLWPTPTPTGDTP
jgi:hypothetical protein